MNSLPQKFKAGEPPSVLKRIEEVDCVKKQRETATDKSKKNFKVELIDWKLILERVFYKH
jgi:hypothetical protein